MVHVLTLKKINFKTEVFIPVNYKGLDLDVDLRCDLLVENALIVEFKSVDTVLPIHIAQLMKYMKLLNCQLA